MPIRWREPFGLAGKARDECAGVRLRASLAGQKSEQRGTHRYPTGF